MPRIPNTIFEVHQEQSPPCKCPVDAACDLIPTFGKLIVHRSTRAKAIQSMKRALDEFHIEGIQTTIPLLQRIFRNSAFLDAKVDTGFIERELL